MMSNSLRDNINQIIDTLFDLLRKQGDLEAVEYFHQSEYELIETGYDNWDGGTYTYSLHFRISTEQYVKLGDRAETLEKHLLNKLERFIRIYPNEHLESIIIIPSMEISDSPPTVSIEDPRFWTPGQFRLFISHTSREKGQASEIAAELSEYGITGFVAHDDIQPTKEWEDEILLALHTMHACLALLTPGFETSNWTGQEVGVAVGRRVLVVPVKNGLDPYGFIGRFQALQANRKSVNAIAREVANILAQHDQTKLMMAHGLVTRFESSSSFQAARIGVENLSLASVMPAQLRTRVREAVRNNEQIKNAWHVPERVESTLSKFE